MFKKRLLVIIYISILLFTFAQEKKPDAAAVEQSWKDKSRAFLTNSIANDIAQSNFSQLKAMAKAVGIKECDNDSQYRKALYDYYGITNPHTVTTKKQGNKIILEEAGELRMHSFKDDDEEYLHFFGKVRIKIDDKDENNATVTKTIQADEIYIDLKNKEISGFGNVYFKDNKLEFNGNQLFYNFKVGRGVLFNGTTKISQAGAGKSGLDGMIFKGEKIVQTDKQDNMLVNGELTTCDCLNPHYSIRVKKVWINQDEEWGLMGAVYNVGSIPFLFIPIYYHPKGIQINPVLGYRSREGWYFNSTYYILGEQSEVKKDSTDTFGVDANRADPSGEKASIQITNAKITEKLNMFYDSHEFYKKHPKMRFVPKDFQSMNLALRVWGDAYTNLG
ncbi:MAG: LPS-assembly protein LptD, partial [Spirochaetales bacterium]|nr:LPS-assembly protein LptD [Spirochaetales bacterium]